MSIFEELGIKEGKGRAAEAVIYNLAACYALAERYIAVQLAEHGLTPVQMNALLIVRHIGGDAGISQTELCCRLIVTAGNVTRLIDRLEREGWVCRKAQAGDRRVNLIRITPEGTKLLERAWPPYLKQVEALTGRFSYNQMNETAIHLERLRLSFKSSSQKGEPI